MRRTKELQKIRERFCKKNPRRATSVPGRADEGKDEQSPEGLEHATSITPGLHDRDEAEQTSHLPAMLVKPEVRDIVLEGPALLSRVRKVLDMLRASDAQFDMAGSRNIWVLKPHGRARGEGIFLSSDLDEILRCGASQRKMSSWIGQKYIENPLLIRGRKHDLRQWVLVTSWNPLTVYFFSEAYIRQASEQFSFKNIKNRAEHLTNLSVTKYHSHFDKFDEFWCCTWSQDTYQEFLENEFGFNAWEERVLPAMKHIVISTLQCVQGDMWESTGATCCFELLGYDFMVDDALKVWLLEINVSPSMAHDTPIHARLVPAVLRDSLRVVGLCGDEPPSPPCFYRLETGNLGKFSTHKQSDAMSGLSVQAQRLERPSASQTSSATPVDLSEKGRSSLQQYMEKVRTRKEREQQRWARRQDLMDSLRLAGKRAWKSTSVPALSCAEPDPAECDTRAGTIAVDGAEGCSNSHMQVGSNQPLSPCFRLVQPRPQGLPRLVGHGFRDREKPRPHGLPRPSMSKH
mmetsp:Transcript_46509/g.86701  ORF Transcript_46509/g.86701 Transcript_46509/m.86701 type:complete len:517 (+) Transcript_46509:61-1611(+)